MFIPMMIRLDRVVVFGGERGEGLQKTEKLALYADEVLVIPETTGAPSEIVFEPGPVQYVAEKLEFTKQVRVQIAKKPATKWNIGHYLKDANFVCSDLSDRALNEKISRLCKKRGIRCNIIDTKDLGDTWFMSLIDVPGLLAGISSRGSCAYASRAAREDMQQQFVNQGKLGLILTELRETLRDRKCTQVLQRLESLHHDETFAALRQSESWEKATIFAQTQAIHPCQNCTCGQQRTGALTGTENQQ